MADEANTTDRAPPPAFLDAAFVQTALRNGGETDAHVDNIEVSFASAPGENYCSSLLRVKTVVRGRDEPLMLLVKVLPDGDQWTRLVHEARLFDREVIAFSQVLPKMEALLETVAPGKFPPFAAKCYHEKQGGKPFVVLQDLRPQGFRMKDRRTGLDLPHALVTIRALGRFHGSSAALWKRQPELFKGLVSMFDDAGAELCADYFDKAVETTAQTIESWTDFPGNYGQKVQKLRKNFFQRLGEVNRVRPGKLNVLIHGDFWINNFLYRYENGEVQDVRFVDFQLSHVGNPAIDLLLFKYICLAEDVFDNEWDRLLEAYCSALSETLQLLGERAPSLDDIRLDMEEARVYTFLATFIWMPPSKLEEGSIDLDKVMEDDRKIHTSPSLRHWLQKLLPMFDKRGMLDEFC